MVSQWLPPLGSVSCDDLGGLVGLDKCLGVRPIGIEYILRILLYKVMLIVMGKETTRAYGTDQLCSGLEAGKEGDIHHMRSLWDEHEKDEDDTWGFLLVGTRNAFNKGNRKMVIWIARYEWPYRSCFLFDIYRYYSNLVIKG